MWIWAYSDGFLWTERIKRIKRIKTDKIWFSLIWLDCLIYLCDFFRFNLISFWPPCTPLYPGGVPFLRGADGAHSFDLRYDYDRIESQIWFYFRFAKFSCISAKCRHIVHSIIARRTGNKQQAGCVKTASIAAMDQGSKHQWWASTVTKVCINCEVLRRGDPPCLWTSFVTFAPFARPVSHGHSLLHKLLVAHSSCSFVLPVRLARSSK